MALDINNPDADAIAMKEAIARRCNAETPLETAARLQEKHGIAVAREAGIPLPRQAFDDMWQDQRGDGA